MSEGNKDLAHVGGRAVQWGLEGTAYGERHRTFEHFYKSTPLGHSGCYRRSLCQGTRATKYTVSHPGVQNAPRISALCQLRPLYFYHRPHILLTSACS